MLLKREPLHLDIALGRDALDEPHAVIITYAQRALLTL